MFAAGLREFEAMHAHDDQLSMEARRGMKDPAARGVCEFVNDIAERDA